MRKNYYQKKYPNPADRLIVLSQPKSEEHKKRISERTKEVLERSKSSLCENVSRTAGEVTGI